MKIRCNICNKDFKPSNNKLTGLPNGMGFQLKDGTLINMCSFCLMYRQKAVEEFLNDLGYPKNEQ